MIFFFKRFSKSYWSGNPIDPKIVRESKKMSEGIKNDTKPGKILAHLYPKKSPNRAKSFYSFQWKLKENRASILIHLDNDFGHFQEVNWGSSWTKNTQDFRYFEKFFVKIRVFQNPLNGICTTMRTTCGQKFSSIWRCLLELLFPNSPPRPPSPPKKNAQWGTELKKTLLFLLGKVKIKKYPEVEAWGGNL